MKLSGKIPDRCKIEEQIQHNRSKTNIMATIKIPTPLRAYTDNQAKVEASGSTVGEALNSLIEQYPDLKPHLFKEDELRNFVNVFLEDEDIRFLDGVETSIEADADLRIIPSIAGGSR